MSEIDVNVTLFKPTPCQKRIIKTCLDDDIFFVIICAGRSFGKSLTLINQALYWVLNEPDTLVYWVSPTAAQSQKVYKSILNEVVKTDLIKSYKGSAGDTEIIFNRNSIIKFRSAQQGDALRGETTVKYLIIDEAAFIKEELYQKVLLQMLTVKGKKCILSSTPKGRNFFHKEYIKGLSDDKKYQSFKFTSYDNPYANKELIKSAKKSLPEVIFSQEYLANFVDSTAIFENIDELSCIPFQTSRLDNDRVWAGIDIGMKNDYTVFSVINDKGEVIYYDRFTDISAPDLKKRLSNNIKHWQPVKTVIEKTGIGLPIYDDLKSQYGVKNLIGFDTTISSKPRIINNLINAFASKKIKLPNVEYIKEEFRAFTMTISSTGRPIFKAETGFYDDCVMSIAILWDTFNKSRYSGKYVFL